MSLSVPIAVIAGGRHITTEVSGVGFRKEAIGGVKSITLRLARPLDQFDAGLTALSKVRLFDAQVPEAAIAEGRLTDFGRSASAGEGQQLDMVAFGPAQHAADQAFPYIIVDTSLERFVRSSQSTKNATTQSDERSEDEPSLVIAAEDGKVVSTTWLGAMIYRQILQAGMKLARVKATVDSGLTDANYILDLATRQGVGATTSAASATANTAGATLSAVVVTNFANGHDVLSVRADRDTSATTGAETHWFEFYNIVVRALLLDKDGTEITTGYTANTVRAHEVVKDLLGRVLDQFDGAGATVDTGGAYTIDQFAFPDGVTAEQVLEELMLLEPAYRWYALPDSTGNGYEFRWEPWPTTVRYEVTLDDGGDFPASAQELYNEVTVRWRGPNGQTRTTTRTLACATLDAQGITRSTIIDAGDETASVAGAQRLGDNFLAEHNVPANAGTITVARPIQDLATGRIVGPHQLEPGELIRVKGVESYNDALNPSSSDGITIFRIWSMTYNSDSHSAQLELDTWSRTTANALRLLAKRRVRKR